MTLYSDVFYFFSVTMLYFTQLEFVDHHVMPLSLRIDAVYLQILQRFNFVFYRNIIIVISLGVYYSLLGSV